MSCINKVRNLLNVKENKYEPKEMKLETIMEINRRIEKMALDYDIPVPYQTDLKAWQKEIMRRS